MIVTTDQNFLCEVVPEEPIEKIKIKYLDPNMPKIEINKLGDWIDLYTLNDESITEDQFKYISLGIAMQLPEGYEAHIVPRSSTFKKYGIIMANSIGIIDNSYCGDNDIWHFPALCLNGTTGWHTYANSNNQIISTKYTYIYKYTRICQFRIVKKQPMIHFTEVGSLENPDRGGLGSTGV